MIDETRARAIATAILGRPSDDRKWPWNLIAFPEGWLIDETSHLPGDYAGALGQVVEKDTGRIRIFPSYVPTYRILTNYQTLAGEGYTEGTVIDADKARTIAFTLLGRPETDPDRPWRLREFREGWIIDENGHLGADFVGSLGRVIEKSSGRILSFPSRIPTDRIIGEYDAVVGTAKVVAPPRR
ncbi:conserved hypothetical protein [Frankia canadensis]|uniref:Uncharacterized protein n=1 Tax=Frankia canadensis TaxID=1836972 RepID=A0A2I2KNI7_9ACTN|nr:hypothetical protein [Frankia canadensis]SNQ47216.1 conserved hypothetical protein [Frankia canadensis]SOU54506.1 conserved hypothetical protein [Frankia canadensis]